MHTARIVLLVFLVFFGISVLREGLTAQAAPPSPAERTARAYENAGLTMVVVTVWAAGQLLLRRNGR